MDVKVNKPVTIYVKFTGNLPRKFLVTDLNDNNRDYFERFLDGKTSQIKFNIPNNGNYSIETPCIITKIKDIEIPAYSIELPKYERNRVKDVSIIVNPELNGTPARIFTLEGVIEKGKKLYNYPKPMRVFFLLHEIAHLYYKTEKYCDLFALVHFLQMGYNMSTAMYCLTNVLRRNDQNLERVIYIYNHLKKN